MKTDWLLTSSQSVLWSNEIDGRTKHSSNPYQIASIWKKNTIGPVYRGFVGAERLPQYISAHRL
jgi:hypothetical protein